MPTIELPRSTATNTSASGWVATSARFAATRRDDEEECITVLLVMRPDGFWRELRASPEMLEYIYSEARRRGISIAEMYDVEMQAAKDIAALGITEEFLDYAMQQSNPPQRLASHNEQCPF